MSDTARALSRCAQPPRGTGHARGGSQEPRLQSTNSMMLQAAGGRSSMGGWMALLRQLERSSQTVSRASALRSEAGQAQQRAEAALTRVGEHRERREQELGLGRTRQTPRDDAPRQQVPRTQKNRPSSPSPGSGVPPRPGGPQRGNGPRR